MLNIKVLKAILLAGATSAVLSTAAMAADPTDGSAPDDGAWDVAFGVTLTSDYIARGISQTAGGPAVQPWAELTVGWFYLGYWGSNVDPVTLGNWEHDLSVGVRPELGPVSLDLGYVNYFYSPGGNVGGELYAQASVSPVDPVTIGAGYWHGVGGLTGSSYVEVNASVDFMEHFSASGAVGWVSATTPYTTWNAGLTWTPIDPLELDFRYHYAPAAAGGVSKFVVSASLSSSLRSLGIIK